MLTHDLEPVIDYIQVVAGKQDPSAVCATYFENINGQIHCTTIQKNSDLMSSVVLLKELGRDTKIDIAARIGCLRKVIIAEVGINGREQAFYMAGTIDDVVEAAKKLEA